MYSTYEMDQINMSITWELRWKAMTRHEVELKVCGNMRLQKMCKKLCWKLATKFNVSNIGMVNIVETYWKQ